MTIIITKKHVYLVLIHKKGGKHKTKFLKVKGAKHGRNHRRDEYY